MAKRETLSHSKTISINNASRITHKIILPQMFNKSTNLEKNLIETSISYRFLCIAHFNKAQWTYLYVIIVKVTHRIINIAI